MTKMTHTAWITARIELDESERFDVKSRYSSCPLRATVVRVDEDGLSEIHALRVLKDGSLSEQSSDVRYWTDDTTAAIPASVSVRIKASAELIKAQLAYVAAGFEVIEP
jgi:hypothetical protein